MFKIGLLFIALYLLLISCSHSFNDEKLVFNKTELNQQDLNNKIVEIDTIESYSEKGIYFVNIITNKAFGKFSMIYGMIKKVNQANDIVYLIETKDSIGIRASKDYIFTVKFFDNAWGWFYRKNNTTVDTLPMIHKILDSIKLIESNKSFYIAESNGNIFFNLNGKHVKFLNYGNIITKYKTWNFDSLDYKLYKLVGDSLIIRSNNANDLINEKEGIFFIPKPGYEVVSKFDKNKVFSDLDSISKLQSHPGVLEFAPIR